MRRLHSITLALLIFTQTGAAAENTIAPPKQMPVETIQKIDNIDKALDSVKDMELHVDRLSRQKYSDCMKAFGNHLFCTCLKDKSPVGVDFLGYVKVVTTSKEDLGYGQADTETKSLIDNTLAAREVCVGSGK
jgi:hypothetical protein